MPGALDIGPQQICKRQVLDGPALRAYTHALDRDSRTMTLILLLTRTELAQNYVLGPFFPHTPPRLEERPLRPELVCVYRLDPDKRVVVGSGDVALRECVRHLCQNFLQRPR